MGDERNQRTIVLGDSEDRGAALRALKETNSRILHDGGGRILVVEAPDQERDLEAWLPGEAKILATDDDLAREVGQPSAQEKLFVDALSVRFSPRFIEERRRREPGSTPEEREMFQASCIPGQNDF